MRKFFVGFFVLLFFQTPLAQAQEPDPERLELATEVLRLTRATEAIEKMMPAMVEQQMQLIEQNRGATPLTEPQKVAVEAAITKFMGSFSESFTPLMDQMAGLYAQKFSRDDLEALRDFYQSDVGKRFIDGGLELAPELARISQTWSMQHVVPAAQQLGAELSAVLKPAE